MSLIKSTSARTDVNEEDIVAGIRNNSSRCVVAVALKRKYPHIRNVRVDQQSIRWSDPKKGKRVLMLTPMKVQEYVIAFDAGDKIKPFSFTVPKVAIEQPIGSMRTPTEKVKRRHMERAKVVKSRPGGKVPLVRYPSGRRLPRTAQRHFGARQMRVNQARVKK